MLESVCWEMNGSVSLRLYKARSGAKGSAGARPLRCRPCQVQADAEPGDR